MTKNLPTRDPDGGSEIADAGWISGSMGITPGYSPAALILDIKNVLENHGISVDPTPGMLHTASIAAGDLLRALGVVPQSMPTRRSQR
jgi:hypothetical protein